ncbi:hypothetical protein GJ744_011791 [Endocarpon pusillum]|uniref:HIT domain-containing protein n=1 Tax=Endocarpon pusillum TaxID=364733 RepID=A0A8H7AG74_9EURO|nr:hypothetical protein GJ744_011791 [Endocarpon pusillum]
MSQSNTNQRQRPQADVAQVDRKELAQTGPVQGDRKQRPQVNTIVQRTKGPSTATSSKSSSLSRKTWTPSSAHPSVASGKSPTSASAQPSSSLGSSQPPSSKLPSQSSSSNSVAKKAAGMADAKKTPTPLKERKCVYCPIIKDVKSAVTKVHVNEDWDKEFLVVQPIGPVTEGHVLVIPRVHVQDAASDPEIFGKTCATAARVAQTLYPGMAVNFANNQGELAEQSVPHLHVHVVPRRPNDGLVNFWTTQIAGHYNTTGRPEHPEHVRPKFPPKPTAAA